MRPVNADTKTYFNMRPSWLGLLPYTESLQWQEKKHAHVLAQLATRRCDHLEPASPTLDQLDFFVAGLMHPSVITLGKRGESSVDVQPTPAQLLERGIEVVSVDRGGQATLHTPGQLVIYPIVPLRAFEMGARSYIELLEATTISFLERYGIQAARPEGCAGPGLYTSRGKIAFFGVRIRNGVTLHGVSINIHNDLTTFSAIRSCGRNAESLDRICEYSALDSCETAFAHWIQAFKDHLGQKKISCSITAP